MAIKNNTAENTKSDTIAITTDSTEDYTSTTDSSAAISSTQTGAISTEGSNLLITDSIPRSKSRIDYIDLLKGITILWIIWVHAGCFDFGNYRNPIFFFASGIFFKLSNAKTFFSKRWLMILVPFCFYYIASIPFRYIVDLWDTRTFNSFDWSRILDLFRIEAESDYLSLNVPLWFPLTLFVIQTYSFVVFRLGKRAILILAILSLLFYEELYLIPTPFMLNNALAWFGYFAIGYLIGKPLIEFLKIRKNKITVILLSLFVLFSCLIVESDNPGIMHGFVEKLRLVSFCTFFMTLFSFFNGLKCLEILRFFGKNSFAVLGAHLWILIPIKRISFRVTGMHDPWIGLSMAIITALLLIPLINWMNNHIPRLVGKRT